MDPRKKSIKRIEKDPETNFLGSDLAIASGFLGGGTLIGALLNHFLRQKGYLFPIHLGMIGGIIGLVFGVIYIMYRIYSIKKNKSSRRRKKKKRTVTKDFTIKDHRS